MSKLSPDAFYLHGGCDCKAIRYRISVPPLAKRPILIPAAENNSGEDVRSPDIYFDHCNRCRTVSGSIVQCWITCPQSWIDWTLKYKNSENVNASTGIPTRGLFHDFSKDMVASVFGHYKSSPEVSRYFCNRCGTNLIFVNEKQRVETLEMDIVLGTLDKEGLEMEGMRPDRHIYWDYGVGWMKRIVAEGDSVIDGKKMPKHPEGSRKVVI